MPSVPPRAFLSVRSTDGGHVIAAYNPLILVCFTRAPREEEIATIRSLVDEGLAANIRGGFLYVVARENLTGGVDPKLRATFEELTRNNAQRAGSTAVVVLTGGFAGAMVRGVITGLALLTPQRRSLHVFGAVDEACRWLAKEHDLDAEALLSNYRRVTAHLPMPGTAR